MFCPDVEQPFDQEQYYHQGNNKTYTVYELANFIHERLPKALQPLQTKRR